MHVLAPTAPAIGGSYSVVLQTRPGVPSLAAIFGALGSGTTSLGPWSTPRPDPAPPRRSSAAAACSRDTSTGLVARPDNWAARSRVGAEHVDRQRQAGRDGERARAAANRRRAGAARTEPELEALLDELAQPNAAAALRQLEQKLAEHQRRRRLPAGERATRARPPSGGKESAAATPRRPCPPACRRSALVRHWPGLPGGPPRESRCRQSSLCPITRPPCDPHGGGASCSCRPAR